MQSSALNPTTQFLIGLCVTLLGGLIAVVWHTGRLSQRLESAIEELRASLESMTDALKQLEKVPVLEQRIGMLEKIQDEIAKRLMCTCEIVAMLRTRAEIISETQRQSHPDLGEVNNEAADDASQACRTSRDGRRSRPESEPPEPRKQ